MTRTICAVIIFFSTVAACLLSLFFLKNTTKKLSNEIYLTKQLINENKTDLATKKATMLKENWEKEKCTLKLFIDHTYLEDIELELTELEINLKNEEIARSLELCEKLLTQIKGLEETEKPTLENIL